MYWKVIDTIPDGWHVNLGTPTQDRAEALAADLPQAKVCRFATQESSVPWDSPGFNEHEHTFRSTRWCVLIPEETT